MKTKNCDTGTAERDKALLDFFDETFLEFAKEVSKLPEEYRKRVSTKVVYQKTAMKFFITENRVRVIINMHRGRKKNNTGEREEA